jgi:hypothetical protein
VPSVAGAVVAQAHPMRGARRVVRGASIDDRMRLAVADMRRLRTPPSARMPATAAAIGAEAQMPRSRNMNAKAEWAT